MAIINPNHVWDESKLTWLAICSRVWLLIGKFPIR